MDEQNWDDKNLVQKVDDIQKILENPKLAKKVAKEVRLPRRARVKKRKLKKGYIGVLKIDENKNISMEKQQIEDSTYRTKDGTYHAMNGEEILMWNGKYPVVIQPVTKRAAFNAFKDGLNQTVGDKLVFARMLKDAIKVKTKAGSFVIWFIIIIAIVIGIGYLIKSGKLGSLFGGK